ncbi:MAG: hypothetical protein WC989_01655 [Micavibrio sp.]
MNGKIQKSLFWAVIMTEASHVFCCVFPTLFSLIGLLAGLGMIATLPPSMVALHAFMHEWEVPMIIGSGIVLTLGWAALWYGGRIDCHSTGCDHGTCVPRQKRAHLAMKIASVLFVVNVLVYSLIHRTDDAAIPQPVMQGAEQTSHGGNGAFGHEGHEH